MHFIWYKLTVVGGSGVHQRPFWGYNARSCSSGFCNVKIITQKTFKVLLFHPIIVRIRRIKYQLWAEAQDLQRGELTHVRKGWVGQRVNLIVAQISGRKIKMRLSSLFQCAEWVGGGRQTKTYTSCRYLKLDRSFGTTLNSFPSRYLH